MDHKDFEHLVRRLELDSHASPAAFRRKVIAISLSAYLVLFGALGGLVASFVLLMQWALASHRAFVTVKIGLFGLFLLPLIFVVLRVMFMRLDRPTGRALAREEAPKLFDILDKLHAKLKGPRIHHVLVTDEYNAAICQHARFGIFGGYRNYLMVGLPYLLGATSKEMLGTLAHEYGHLCGNHGKLATSVYRQRRLFVEMYQHVEESAEDNVLSRVMAGALGKFFPYYSAYTFVLARQQEYEADAMAVEMAGRTARANGLVRVHLLGPWVYRSFWPKMYENADRAERPPFMPYASMRMAFRANYDDWANKAALDAAWAVRSDVDDTHPCLRERLDAIGLAPSLPEVVDLCSADVMLASGVGKQLEAEFDKQWWEANARGWRERYRHVTTSHARIGALAGQPLAKLTVADMQELASLQLEFGTPDAAKPVLQALLKRPGGPFPKASLLYGRVLLAEGNRQGVDHLREAALNDPRLLNEAAQRGYHYLLEKEGEDSANLWWSSVVPEEETA
ncbi:M48 family metalloprotease [Pseudoduganella eburnea]|uniref:M48 family metalloprotease n=1 Tax=Massilia eburnea TaxID=1776165 RepID=A0A6L6QPL6_9BURK|nr:M48 family metallopeptidase [Massilia eburnea]MTW14061.1 M48 family metalloprotease [Massilia eburnea]